jgi:hypothetical protein
MDDYNTLAHRLMWVLWPAFLVAGAACGVFFTVVDPTELTLFGHPLEASREVVYTVGFFAFWIITSASSALTVYLERSPWEVNRCPLPPSGRPEGCPKRDGEPC